MSWLDANEAFLMQVVSRDRVEDLRLAIDLARESAAPETEAPAAPCDDRVCWWRRVSVARA